MLSGGIYFFLSLSSTESSIISNTHGGLTIETTFYDSHGREISRGIPQTTVGGVSGIYYMTLKLRASNTGTALLSNLRITETHPTAYTYALQGQAPSRTTLTVGENNIGILNTTNTCSTNNDCGASEKCLNSKCLIDIGNFLGEVTFGASLSADYTDAYGSTKTTSTVVNLPLVFQQDKVIFRAERSKDLARDKICINSWMTYDINNDGIMEKFGSSSNCAGSGGGHTCNPTDATFITYYGNYIVKTDGGRTLLEFCDPSNGLFGQFTTANSNANRAIVNLQPTEPYKSQLCNGNIPCQEIYSVLVSQPVGCTDTIKNQDETDADCGGTICPACANTKMCTINEDCSSGYCNSGTCANPIYITFRTLKSVLDCNPVGGSDEIAFTPICGQAPIWIDEYGSSYYLGAVGTVCSTYMPANGYTKIMDIPSGITLLKYGTAYNASSNFGLWNKTGDYFICGDNPRVIRMGFDTPTSSETPTVSLSPVSVDATKETTCTI